MDIISINVLLSGMIYLRRFLGKWKFLYLPENRDEIFFIKPANDAKLYQTLPPTFACQAALHK